MVIRRIYLMWYHVWFDLKNTCFRKKTKRIERAYTENIPLDYFCHLLAIKSLITPILEVPTIYKAYCSGHFFQEISQILCPKYGTIVPSHFRIQVRSPMISSSLGGDLSPLISAFHSAFFMGKSTISCRLGHGLIRSRTVNVRDPEGSWSAAP